MPRTTHAYAFEAAVGAFAGRLCSLLRAGKGPCTFLLTLDAQGEAVSLEFERQQWRARVEELRQLDAPFIFFDPVDDGMEYVWLEWSRVPTAAMERLVGRGFEGRDFVPFTNRRAVGALAGFPERWGVMF